MADTYYAYPPRGMSREEAARYIGVSQTLFDEMVGDGRMPKAKRINSRVVWDRVQLDVAFTDLGQQPTGKSLDELLGRCNRR